MRALAIGTMVAGMMVSPVFAQVTPAAKAKPDASDRLICHREEITGSLAGGRKTCLTKAQWEAQARASQAIAERLVDQGRITSCGSTTPGVC